MPSKYSRRTYYDHEGQYRQIIANGGDGWDALSRNCSGDSYFAFDQFLQSPIAACIASNGNALDLGCGGGQVAIKLALRGFQSHGVDFSPTAISLARANARAAGIEVEFSEGDCLALETYADASMDLVTDNHVFHCIVAKEDRRAFLRAAFRVLKPGGILFSEMMTREGDFLASTVDADPQTFIAKAYNRYWAARQEALDEFRTAGFEIVFEQLKAQPQSPGVGDLLTIYARRPHDKSGPRIMPATQPPRPAQSPRSFREVD